MLIAVQVNKKLHFTFQNVFYHFNVCIIHLFFIAFHFSLTNENDNS